MYLDLVLDGFLTLNTMGVVKDRGWGGGYLNIHMSPISAFALATHLQANKGDPQNLLDLSCK